MNPKVSLHPWSSEALFDKALLYVNEMERYTANDWQFGLWSSLALEMMARAALAKISPVLVAARSENDWDNLLHALEYPPTSKKFVPKSRDIHQVYRILSQQLKQFNPELLNFCVEHCVRRNAELHSGEDAFVGKPTSEWLPKFYASCEVFLNSMGKNLVDFAPDPQSAQQMIAALRDKAAKAVTQEIESHKAIWKEKCEDDQKLAIEQAKVWATRHTGHRVDCPACGSSALVRGTRQGTVTTEVDEANDEVVQKQNMLPSLFECIACGLRISGLSKLSACNLGDLFTATTILSPADFFQLHTEEELREARESSVAPEYEEDFNEYGFEESDG